MKRFLFIIALSMAVALSAQAQSRKSYQFDPAHNGVLSNWNIGVFGQGSFYHGTTNFGIGGFATKQLDDYLRFRAEAAINGLKVVEGFDRNGTLFAGLQFNFVEWIYLFAEWGVKVDPAKIGLGGSAGLGLKCNFGRWSGLLAEGGANLIQNGANLDNMLYARIGYFVRPGITKRDKEGIDFDNKVRTEYGNQKEEIRILKTEVQKCTEATATIQAAAEEMQQMVISLRAQCTTLEKEKKEMEGKAVDYSMFKFHFNCGSAVLSEIQELRVGTLASYINSTGGQWRVDGYASPEGPDYNNMILSQQRAETVCEILEAYGVDKERLIPMGNGSTAEYGEDSPLNRMVVVSKIVP